MDDEIIRQIYVAIDIEEYRGFFTGDWARKIDERSASSPKLQELVIDLVMDWRAASYTAAMPVSIIDHIKAFYDGFVSTGEVNTNLLDLLEKIPAALAKEMPEFTADPELLRKLQKRVLEVADRLNAARTDATVAAFSLDEMWKSYLEDHVFQLSLWGSQRVCYLAFYNAYDNFLARCVQLVHNPNARTTDRDFPKQLEAAFGATIANTCWTSSEMNLAKITRHSLVHAGGRLTHSLSSSGHPYEVRNGRIQITPRDVKTLIATFANAVSALVEKCVT